ncbi:hypothetical protein Tco_0273687 [Tanacetum coccineum]
MAAIIPQSLDYKDGQLNAAPKLEVENVTNWKKRFMRDIVRIEPQFKNIVLNGPYVPMVAGVRKPEAQWTGDERKAANLDQCHKSLIMDYELASLFGKLKYEENLIDSIYDIEKKKSLSTTTPLSIAFFSNSLVQDFQDSPDDEEDTRSSQEYMNDLEREFHERSLLAKSKRFFKKGTQRFSGAKATDQTGCFKCERTRHFMKDCFSKTSVPSYASPFQNKTQPKFITSSQQHKPELRPNIDFEAKYNKVKAKLALLSSGASTSKSSQVRNQGLVAKAYEWDEEEVSSDDNEMTKVKVLVALADDEGGAVGKESARNGKWVKIFILKGADQLTKDSSNSGQKDLVFVKSSSEASNVILLVESQVNVTHSLVTDYDSVEESTSVCSTFLPPLEKLAGAEPETKPKTIKSILKSCSNRKSKTSKYVIINEAKNSSAFAKGNKIVSAFKKNSALVGKMKNVKTEDDIPMSVVMKELNDLKLQISKNQSSYNRNNKLQQVPQTSLQTKFKKSCELCRMNNHLLENCYKGLFCKKYERTNHRDCDHVEYMSSMNMCDIRKPIWYLDSGCLRHMTGVKSYLQKYVEQLGPKMVFRDDSRCTTKGYGSIKCNGIVSTKVAFVNGLKYNLVSISQLCDAKYIVQFDEKRGIIFNSNKEVVMIAPRIRVSIFLSS